MTNLSSWNDFESYEEMLFSLDKSSVDNKTIFKHLDKLSEGKLSFIQILR